VIADGKLTGWIVDGMRVMARPTLGRTSVASPSVPSAPTGKTATLPPP